MRARIDEGSELFMRNRLRVMVESDHGYDGRLLIYAERVEGEYRQGEPGMSDTHPMRWPGWYDPHLRPEDGGIPEGASPFVLDCQRDVAHAVYKALGEYFEGADPTPVASDRAYADARADVDRLFGLVDRLVDPLVE